MLEQIFYSAVIPGIGIGVGYLSTFYVTNMQMSGREPPWLNILLALIWQFVILPANVVVAFLYLPWFLALVVVPSILLGAGVGGILSMYISDKNAAWIGPIIGLVIAGFKLITYFVDH